MLCGALINPTGNLEQAWTIKHPRDETVSPHNVRKIIKCAVEVILKSEFTNELLIMRDGRIFEKEKVSTYLKGLGIPVTFMEIRKYNNPVLLTNDSLGIPTKPVFAEIPQCAGSHVAFMVTLPTANEGRFGSVIKCHWRDEWNKLSLQPRDFAAILAALVHAPSLGNQAHKLPAPIYWADGIAKASDTDLRFRGQKTTRLSP